MPDNNNNNNMKDYTVAQVASWVKSLGVPNAAFVENEVDGDLLFSCSKDDDFIHLGLTGGQIKLLQRELGQTKFSSYKEQTERTLEYLQQENEDLARENELLEKRNSSLEKEVDRLRKGMMYQQHASRFFPSQYATGSKGGKKQHNDCSK
eukprot:CAMPEP_0119007712 /NCGR_PEP_ID=MMETSP1176-20130426/3197_1 /TAXON_ID=265551 /ORGANISM="Synedropsis recta cf, Strain CCMP1620" /LENGTH=149 /DNA_ID=CAMNT_0006959911 /DNA_START=44 /DNA_END=491 /DNA_ORIENTATION=+